MPYLLGQLLKKKLQDKKYSKSWKVIDKLKYLVQLVGMNNDESTMENNMAVPQKNYKQNMHASSSISGYLSKELKFRRY